MDPQAQAAGTGPATISPSFSPLHPPSVQHNTLILNNLSTLTCVFSGTLAGILGLVNSSGFCLYVAASLLNALVVASIKCKSPKTGRIEPSRYLASLHQGTSAMSAKSSGQGAGSGGGAGLKGMLKVAWSLMAIDQDNVLTFLLFWIGFYAIIHVYD